MRNNNKGRIARLAAAGFAALAIGGSVATSSGAANASTTHPYFKLYHNGNSTAKFNSHGKPVLTAGTVSGTSAQVWVLHPPAVAPLTGPTFTANTSGGGDPRWVIEFHNGCYLFGFPNEAGYTSANAWSVEPGVKSGVSYAQARAIATSGECGLDNQVTAAFIVDDAGYPGHAVTLTGVKYNGHTLTAANTIH